MVKTKGQIEAEIGDAIIKFEKEYLGRGPEETKTFVLEDLVLVRLRGVLTPAEKQLAKVDQEGKGRSLIEKARVLLDTRVRDITGFGVKSLHTDISTLTGERVIIFTLDGKPQFREQP
jgi:uncharacterized protein YbcI